MNFLYIDPGTGSMLFSVAIGIATTSVFLARAVFIKLKFLVSGGKSDAAQKGRLPFVIFSDHKRYWNVFEAICDEFEKRKIDVAFWTASPDDPALQKKYEHVKCEFIGEGNKAFARLNFLKADVVLATTPGLDVYQWKRSRDVSCYVHIPHSEDDLASYRMFGLDYYDAVLTSGEHQRETLQKLEAIRPNVAKKEFALVGSAPLDALKARLASSPRAALNEKKVVLVAPSWGESAILSRFGERFLDALSKTDYEIVVRPHPQSTVSEAAMLDDLQKKFPQFEWNFDNNNFDALNRADILISDFSSVIFDFALVFDKPVMFADTKFDPAPYDAWWLKEELWTLRSAKKIGIELKESDFDGIGAVIEGALKSEVLKDARQSLREECWQREGECAKLSVDFLVAKQAKIAEKRLEK